MEKVKERLFYIDNLRLLMIVFVVMHHLAVTYSGFGSWYYNEGKHLDILSTIWFAFYLSFQQGYFMGFLFMIAGYFVAGSYDRKGFGQFVGERFKRLVIPSLIYMVVITPFIGYVELGNKWAGFSIFGFLSGTGVMWFAVALFIFSLIYGLVRLIVRRPAPVSNRKQHQTVIYQRSHSDPDYFRLRFSDQDSPADRDKCPEHAALLFRLVHRPFHRGYYSLQKQPVRQDQL